MQSSLTPEVMVSFLSALNSQLRLEPMMAAVLDVSLALTRAGRAFLLVYDRNGELSLHAARDSSGRTRREEDFEGSTSIIEKVIREQQPVYVSRLSDVAEFAASQSIRKWNLQSALCLPLIHCMQDRREPVGVLYLDSSTSSDPLTEEHLQIMQAMASFLAVSIANARLFQQVEEKQAQVEALNCRLVRKVEVQEGDLHEMKMLLAETQRELGKVYGLGHIVGKSKAMLKVYKILQKVVSTEATVLIQGQSGTGKELVARYIHFNGPRAERALVSVNCSAFSETLLESELFGHRKGAFTGATQDKMGLFQLADGGTLFLDEVGDMSAEMQKKLLRVLQDGEIRPLGSNDAMKVDVRILAATNRKLQAMVKDGGFREDLYFRLNVIHIDLPALNERPEDIPLLMDHFRARISEELKRPLDPPPALIWKEFLKYDWPGNVRQLENELRRFYILESEYDIEELRKSSQAEQGESYTDLEKRAIMKALESANGNKSKAAEIVGMPRRTFYRKLIKYNIY